MMPDEIHMSVPGGFQISRVVVGAGVLDRVGPMLAEGSATMAAVIADATVWGLFGERVVRSLSLAPCPHAVHVLPPGEGSKGLQAVEGIYGFFARERLDRRGVVVAVGGGVVGDAAGFAAATWMRGVRHVNIPTTLEAMIDASIGGKTGVNLEAGKNLVGAFHHPVLVLMDPVFLSTLSPRDVRAGLAESVKHALVFDERFTAWQESNATRILALDPEVTKELLRRNVEIKAGVVAADPREETGLRALLNFGHTIGHAMESACAYRLRHGECVALGMAAACRLSAHRTGLSAYACRRALNLIRALELPTAVSELCETIEPVRTDEVLARLSRDKKAIQGRIRFVLLEAIGKARLVEEVPEDEVREAVAAVLTT